MTAPLLPKPGPMSADDGSVTLFVVIAVVGLLALAGLVVDGGAKVRAAQRADRIAAEAARAAGQAVDVAAMLAGRDVRVDGPSAVAAARQYLASAGVDGTAVVENGGRTVVVSTRSTASTLFLGLIGISEMPVQGRAEATLTHSMTGAIP